MPVQVRGPTWKRPAVVWLRLGHSREGAQPVHSNRCDLSASRDKRGSFDSILPLTFEVSLAKALQETLSSNGETGVK